ncbi:MAG: CDP-alcohol phosphatidyltransferase family protein [Paludibacteraceae bacterium]|nr:CDP-alcohol phosphatidyltransferase family protein [Paludibacteraceae bacterium]
MNKLTQKIQNSRNKDDAEREYSSLVSKYERKALIYLAQKIYKYVTADSLTYLGLLGCCLVALSIVLYPAENDILYLGILGLFINWFGDSLDGSVAALRGEYRSKYGYFMDTLVDVFSYTIILIVIALSGFTSSAIWVTFTILFLFSAFYYVLKCSVTKIKQMNLSIIGGTEMRIIFALILLSLILNENPKLYFSGLRLTYFDWIGLILDTVLGVGVFISIIMDLYGKNKIPNE